MDKFDLTAYLSNSGEKIVKNILRATLKDPRESAFMLRYSAASRRQQEGVRNMKRMEKTFRRS